MIENGRKKLFYGYVLVVAGIVASIFMVGTYTSFGIFFKPMSTELGWARATTSWAVSFSSLSMGLASIISGRLTDRFGARVVLVASGLLMGLGNFLMSRVSAAWQMYLFYGLFIGIGMSASEVPIVTPIARWFVRRRGTMTGITKVGAGVGIMVVPLLSRWLIDLYDWRSAYVIIGGLAFLFITSMALLYKRDPSDVGQFPDGAAAPPPTESATAMRVFSLKEAMGTRQFWMFALIWFSFMFCLQVVMVHIVNHVTDLEISATIAATVVSVIGGASILGRLWLAGLSDVIGPRSAYIIAFSFLAGALLLLQFASQTWMFYLFAACYGMAHGACFALLSPMMARLFGLQSLGSIMGVILFFGTLGSLVSPILAGRIFDASSNYQLAFWLCFAVSLLGLSLLLLLRMIKRR